MEKRISQKMILAISAIVIALIAIVAAVFILRGNKTYRSIKIVELEGDVNIDREGVSGINASVNMNLVSGDRLTTGQDAYVVLCLDTDKYVMLGEYGSMKVNAEGKENASRTSVELEAGSVLSEIQNPLGKDSTYDIVTPNATMSVRGTVFEVYRDMTEKNISVFVYDGCVAVAPAGTDTVEYHAGEYTVFTDSNPAVFVTEKAEITAEQINEQMLERLKKIEHNGRTLNLDGMTASAADISEESISEKISEKYNESVEKEEEPDAEPSPEKNNVTSGNKTGTASGKDNAAEEPAPEQEAPETTPQNNSGGGSSSGKKKKPKPSEENKEPSSSETPTESSTETSTEAPTESSSEESSEPENEKISVTYYLPYIALWGEDANGKYSTIMDYEPILAGENHDIIKGSKLQKPADVTVGMTKEGWINEKKDLKHVGWCNGDGRQWDFDADVATEDIILYPIWQDSQGRKYYPCFYSKGDKTYPCNSIIEGSVPEV